MPVEVVCKEQEDCKLQATLNVSRSCSIANCRASRFQVEVVYKEQVDCKLYASRLQVELSYKEQVGCKLYANRLQEVGM